MSINDDGFHNIPIRGNTSNLPITHYDIDAGIRLSLRVHQEVNIEVKNLQVGGNYFDADVLIVNGDSNLVFNQDLTTEQVSRYYIYYQALPEIDREKEAYINQSIRDETGSETFKESFIRVLLQRYYLLYNWRVDPVAVAEKIKQYIIGDKPEDEITEDEQAVIDSLTKIATEKDEKIKAYQEQSAADQAASSQALANVRKKFEAYVLEQLKEFSDDFKKLIKDAGASMIQCSYCKQPSIDDAVAKFNSELAKNSFYPFTSLDDAEHYGFCRSDDNYWVLNGDCDHFMTDLGPREYTSDEYKEAIDDYNRSVNNNSDDDNSTDNNSESTGSAAAKREMFDNLAKVNAYNNYNYIEPAYQASYNSYSASCKLGGFVAFEPFVGGADWVESGDMGEMRSMFLDPTRDTRNTTGYDLDKTHDYSSVVMDRNTSLSMYDEEINGGAYNDAVLLFRKAANDAYNAELISLYAACTTCILRYEADDVISFLGLAKQLKLPIIDYTVQGFKWKTGDLARDKSTMSKEEIDANAKFVQICNSCLNTVEADALTKLALQTEGTDEYNQMLKDWTAANTEIQAYINRFVDCDGYISSESEKFRIGDEIVDSIRDENQFSYWYDFASLLIANNCICQSQVDQCNHYCPPQVHCKTPYYCCCQDTINTDTAECSEKGYEWGIDGKKGSKTKCEEIEDKCEDNNEIYANCDGAAWMHFMMNNPSLFEDFNNLWVSANDNAYLFKMLFIKWIMNSFMKNSGIPFNDPTFSDPCHPIYSTIKSCFGCPLRFVSTPTIDPESCDCDEKNDPAKKPDIDCTRKREHDGDAVDNNDDNNSNDNSPIDINVTTHNNHWLRADENNSSEADNSSETDEGEEYGYFEFYDKTTGCTCGRVPIETIVNAIHIEYENRADYYFRYYKEYRVENYITISSIQEGVSTNIIKIHMADSKDINMEVDEEIKSMQRVILLFDSIDRDVLGLPPVEDEFKKNDDEDSDSNDNSKDDEDRKKKRTIIVVIIIIVLILVIVMILILFSQASAKSKKSKSKHKSKPKSNNDEQHSSDEHHSSDESSQRVEQQSVG